MNTKKAHSNNTVRSILLILYFGIFSIAQARSNSISYALQSTNEIVTWIEILYENELYEVQALVSVGTDIHNVSLDQGIHNDTVHKLFVIDSTGSHVTNIDLAWKIILAAQNALEFEEHGKTDVSGFSTRPINFLGLYSGTRDSDNSQYFIRTVFEADNSINNDFLFSTAFGTKGLDNDAYRRKLYTNLILSMAFQQEISGEFQELQIVEYEKELEQELLREALHILELDNQGAQLSQALVDLAKVIVYSGNAVEKDLLNNAGLFDEWVILAESQTFKRSLNQLKNVMGVFETTTQINRAVVQGLFIHSMATEEAGIRLEVLEEFVLQESHRIDGQLILAVEDAREEFNNIQESTYYAIGQSLLEALPGILNLEELFIDWGIHFAQHFELISSKAAHRLHKAFGPASVIIKITFDLEEDIDILRHASLAMTMDYYMNVHMQDLPAITSVEEAFYNANLYNMRYFIGFYNYEYIRRALDNSWWDPLYWLNISYLFSGQGSEFNEEIDNYAIHNITYFKQSIAPYFLATDSAEWLSSLTNTLGSYNLILPSISPSSIGDTLTEFDFSIVYLHEDNLAPDSINLVIEGQEYALTSTETTFDLGVEYSSSPLSFDVGTYFYSFKAVQGVTEVTTNLFSFTVNNPAPEHDLQISSSDTNKENYDPDESAVIRAQVTNLSGSTAHEIVIDTIINGPNGYSWASDSVNIGSLDSNQYWPDIGSLDTVANWPGNNTVGEYTITIHATCPTCDQNWSDNSSILSILVTDDEPLDYMFYQYATFEDIYYDFSPSSSPPGWSGGYFGPISTTVNGNSIEAWVQPSSSGERFRAHITRNGVLCREYGDGTFDYQKAQYTCTNDTVVIAVIDYFEVHSVPEDWISTIILGGFTDQITLTPPVQTVAMGEVAHYDATIPCSTCDYRDELVYQATQGEDPPSVFFDREWDEFYDLDEDPPDISLDIEPRQEGEHNFIIDTGPENGGGWGYFIAGKIIGYTPIDNSPNIDMVSHIEGQIVSGLQEITTTATDDNGIIKVEFYLDGNLLSTDTVSPYNNSWDTMAISDGNYTISATAYDTINQTAGDSVSLIVDNNSPNIANVVHSPTNPTDSDTVTIDVTITDASGVSNAVLSYSIDGGTNWTLLTMNNVSGDNWQITIPAQDQGQILYNIEATDSLAKTTQSTNFQYDIVDASLPIFFGWTETPANLTEDSIGSFRVTVSVSDIGGSGLDGQTPQLDFRIGTGTYDGYEDMINEIDNTWYFDIPAQDWTSLLGQNLYYLVRNSDLAGNEAISDERIELIDSLNDAPDITDFEPVNLTPEVDAGSCLNFSVTATDDDDDTLTYEWQVDTEVQSTSNSFVYCPLEADIGEHTVVALVNDNIATSGQSWQVTVNDGSGIICYDLTLTHSGSGTDPIADLANSDGCPISKYVEGEVIGLSATADPGWHIASWSGTDDDSSIANTNTLTMLADHHIVTVTYEADTPICFQLTLNHTGNGSGPIADIANSSQCPTGQYIEGELIELTATPDAGWHIASWNGTDDDMSVVTTNQLTMPASNHTVTVVYESDAPVCYPLTLTHTGSGADPLADIANSAGCPVGEYSSGEILTLTAAPDVDWSIDSWVGTDNDASTANVNTLTMSSTAHTVTVNYTSNSGIIIEEFDSDEGFTQTDPDVFIENGKVNWTVFRDGGDQFIYRDIPAFSGDVKLTVTGQVDSWTNNCQVRAGIGDGYNTGLSINYGFFGGGCSTNGPVILGNGASLDYSESSCNFTGNWLWITASQPYEATFTLSGETAELDVPGVGTSSGTPTYDGEYNTLYVGLAGGGDWPQCSGTIESMIIEPLPPPPQPFIEASLTSDWISAWNFTPNSTVTFEIYDSLGGAIVYGPVSVSTDDSGAANIFVEQHNHDLVGGTYITVIDDTTTNSKTLEMSNVRVDVVNNTSDIISGIGPANEILMISAISDSGYDSLNLTADSSGNWSADFGIAAVDISENMQGEVHHHDVDGDATQANSSPHGFRAFLNSDRIEVVGHTLQSSITFEIYDAPNGNLLFGPYTKPTDDNTSLFLNAEEHNLDLIPGYFITVTDDSTEHQKTIILELVGVNSLDHSADTISGFAPPNASVIVYAENTLAFSSLITNADGNGDWNADFSASGTNLFQGMTVEADVSDDHGDTTVGEFLSTLPVCLIQPIGLHGWWSGNSNASDPIGQNDGILMGGTSFVPGLVDQAFHFNGVDSYIEVPDNDALDNFTAITVEAWINTTDTGDQSIISKYHHSSGGNLDDAYSLDMVSGVIGWQINAGNSFNQVTGVVDITDGNWHHVVGTWDGALQSIYVDGQLINSVSYSGDGQLNNSGQPVTIGRRYKDNAPEGYFDGDIDELSIYNRALSLEEIESIYDAVNAGKCQPPSATLLIEEFDSDEGFIQTDPDVFIEDGKVNWTVFRDGGDQFVYRDIPAFSGDVKLTVTGQVDSWTNNCQVRAGIGDGYNTGLSINYGFFGGGCSTNGPVILGSGAALDYSESSCSFTGNWLWITSGTPYEATFTLSGESAELDVPGIGTTLGTPSYDGEYNTLYVGLAGGGDWPQCSGTIESIIVEPLATKPEPTFNTLPQGGIEISWSHLPQHELYEVWRSTNPYANPGETGSELLATLGAPLLSNTLSFTDENEDVENYYYTIRSRAGTTEALSERIGVFQIDLYPGWNLLSLPLLFEDLTLDAVLGTQLFGTEDPLTADRVLIWDADTQSYDTAWYCGGVVCESWGEPFANHWLANDYSQSPLTIKPDTGFWLQNRSGQNETLLLIGKVPLISREVVISEDWQLLGSNVPIQKALDEANIPANGTEDPLTADRILYWDATTQSYESSWFCGGPICEGWGEPFYNHWLANDFSLSTVELIPGHGFWYQNRHSEVIWTNLIP